MNRLSSVVPTWTVASLVASVLVQSPAAAQQPAPYTETQAEAGANVYASDCRVCHRANFEGSFEAPELAGPNFRNAWGARPLSELQELIATTMPPDEAGSLTPENVSAVVAYLLQANELLQYEQFSQVVPPTEQYALHRVCAS